MKSLVLVLAIFRRLIQYPQPVGDAWDEETRLRMEVRAKELEWERIRLEQEVEQLTLKPVQLVEPLQLLAAAVLLVLVFVLCLIWCKRSLGRQVDNVEHNGADEDEGRHGDANEEDVGNAGEDVQGDGHAAANGADHFEDEVVHEAANAGNNALALAVYEEDNDFADHIGRLLMERIQCPVQDLQAGCEWTRDLMENYLLYFGHILANSFYPVLQRAIGVGSAFEGWSPREQDAVYQVLIPMTPPRGHSFHLELDSAEHRHVRNFRVRVQLECTCRKEQEDESMLCFLHHPEEELRNNQDPSLLETLCTDSYLDVEKTAQWFYLLVRAVWPALPQSHNWHLKLLPSRRSCQFQVTNGRESFRIEMFFGVQREGSDIFVSSQPREAYTQSTAWPETYAVAEVKFFKLIAKQAPPDSVHLKCLQFFARLLQDFSFSTYSMKTIVMHSLNVVPVTQWRRRDLLKRLQNINKCLCLCLLVKRLRHFIVGNQGLPPDIILPQDVQDAQQYNLFHHLIEEPAAHSQAINDYQVLQETFKRIIQVEQ